MKVGVIGLGKSGLSACEYLQKKGYSVFAVDDKKVIDLLPRLDPEQLDGFSFIIISPGISLTHPVAKAALDKGIEVFCDVELAFRQVRGATIVAITGSNGKTTTTSLTTHLLNASGIKAKAVGNIGNPILSEIQEEGVVFVCELSSFQLETMQAKVLDAACILNITPNHLDRHCTMQAYTQAKQRIGLCLKPEGELWVGNGVNGQCHFGFDPNYQVYTDGKSIFRFGKKEGDLPKSLQHNKSFEVENFLAAYALVRHLGVMPDAACNAYSTFKKPKHRLEFVRTYNDIDFYDDSKATSVDAVVKGLECMTRPVVLIAGGVHKGHPYHAWKEPFKEKVRSCVLIGEAKELIKNDLDGIVPTHFAETLDQAVSLAVDLARSQDAILLGPGCSSYDMFSNYEERGRKFQEIINGL